TYNVTTKGTYVIKAGIFEETVTALAPAEFVLSNLTVEPTEGEVPFNVTINVTVTNIGDVKDEYTVILYVNGKVVENTTVTLAGGASSVVTFIYEITEAGKYNISVNDLEPVVVIAKEPKTDIPDLDDILPVAENVYIVVNRMDAMDYIVSGAMIQGLLYSNGVYPIIRADENFNISAVTSNDVVISVGGPLVNSITALYEDIAPVRMVIDGRNITIVSPEGNVTWTAPTPWWNVTEGYFIIQIFTDENSGALVVTIYGTDADSTAAGAYYFAEEIWPSINDFIGIQYIVGKWIDTEEGASYDVANLMDPEDTSGFSYNDDIEIVSKG
ncbi:TPA: hypothetical protein EYP13_00050, partial [Candidatus Micrarchaeota archaeon]|nr:hypothetical protein [Candidatus Micrarchaeota archaeon]